MKRKVKEIKVPKVVHVTNLPKGVVFIGEDGLYNIVDDIMRRSADKNDYLDMKKSHLKVIIYDLVIEEFRKKKYYYKGLNLNLILKQVNKLLNKYTLKDNNPMEEYDQLCFLKINGKAYSKQRFKELQKELLGEDSE